MHQLTINEEDVQVASQHYFGSRLASAECVHVLKHIENKHFDRILRILDDALGELFPDKEKIK